MASVYDCIVVGSGPAGAMCAQTLVESGRSVLLIDAGFKSPDPVTSSPGNFSDLRKKSSGQREIFLGKDLTGLDVNAAKAFGQITPQRRHVIDDVETSMPLHSEEFSGVESLATGGLGEAWGLGCFTFSDKELAAANLNIANTQKAYEVIANRIGISYSADDIKEYTVSQISSLQPAIEIDNNARDLLRRYTDKRKSINQQGFHAGIPALALLTQDKNGRRATDYSNMDFYYNTGHSAYRPSITIEELKANASFTHLPGIYVASFVEEADFVKVNGVERKTGNKISFKTRRLVLACNVLSTARVVLRSFEKFDTRIPLLCNPYSMVMSVQLSQLGKLPSTQKTSTAQICLVSDKRDEEIAIASVYSYSSLMMYRLLKEMPLNFKDSMRILQYMQSALVITGIHHPCGRSEDRFVSLHADGSMLNGDVLMAGFRMSDAETLGIRKTEKSILKMLRKLGCIPVKKVTPRFGASAHYAGTLPFSSTGNELTLSPEGLLSATKNVYVSDASGFCYLPAKGPTLTIMANAHNIALNIIKDE